MSYESKYNVTASVAFFFGYGECIKSTSCDTLIIKNNNMSFRQACKVTQFNLKKHSSAEPDTLHASVTGNGIKYLI